jgi:methionyl aminopeptidase
MRQSNLIVAEILEALKTAVRPGVTTRELDEKATALLAKTEARPAFKGYNPECFLRGRPSESSDYLCG